MSGPTQQRSSGSSLDDLNLENDEFSTQDLSSVLPPSIRSRRGSAITVTRAHTPQSKPKPSPRASALKRQSEREWYYGELQPSIEPGKTEIPLAPVAPSPEASVESAAPPTTSDGQPQPALDLFASLETGMGWGTGAPAFTDVWSTGAPTFDMPPPEPQVTAVEAAAEIALPAAAAVSEAPEQITDEAAPVATRSPLVEKSTEDAQDEVKNSGGMDGARTEHAEEVDKGSMSEQLVEDVVPLVAVTESTAPRGEDEQDSTLQLSPRRLSDAKEEAEPPVDSADPFHDQQRELEAMLHAATEHETKEAAPTSVSVQEEGSTVKFIPVSVQPPNTQEGERAPAPQSLSQTQEAAEVGSFVRTTLLTPERPRQQSAFDAPREREDSSSTGGHENAAVAEPQPPMQFLSSTSSSNHNNNHFSYGAGGSSADPLPMTQPVLYDGHADDADATEFDDFTVGATHRFSFDSVHKRSDEGSDRAEGRQRETGVGAHPRSENGHTHTRLLAREDRNAARSSALQPSAPDETYTYDPSASSRDVNTGEDDSFSPRSQWPPVPFTANVQRDRDGCDTTGNSREDPAPEVVASVLRDGETVVSFAEHLNAVTPVTQRTSDDATPVVQSPMASGRGREKTGEYDELDEMNAEVAVRPLAHWDESVPQGDSNSDSSRGATLQKSSGTSRQCGIAAADDGESGGTLQVGEIAQKLTDDELQEARFKAYGESSSVSTLDFLRETGDSVLPDAVLSMFAITSNFFQSGKDAISQNVPEPLRKTANKTGRGIALFADFTGDLIANAPEYVMAIIPDAVVSQETKQLIFVDFLAVLRVTLDVNILAVPYVFRMAGLLGGLLILVVVHLLCYYNTVVFFGAKNQLKDASSVVMYGDVPRLTWGKWYPMISLWYGAAFLIAYITYAASNLHVLLGTMGITGGSATALAVIMPSVFALPFVFLKRASTQKPLAAIASLLVFVSVVMFMSVFPYKTPSEIKKAELRLWATDVVEFFVALGIAVYIFCPLRTAVPVERGMSPRRFVLLLRIAMAIAFSCHLVFGLCAFITLRTDTCSVLAVSLPNGPVATAAAAILFFAFLCIIPLALFRIAELCDRRVLGVRTLPTYWQLGPNIMRIIFLAGAIVVASVLPYYGLLVGVGGAFGCGIIGIVVPAALDYMRRERLRLRRGRHLRWWEYIVVFSNLLFGAIAVVLLGMVFSFYQLWVVLQAGYKNAC